MKRSTSRLLQAILLIAILAAAVRLIVILRQRHRPAAPAQQATKGKPLNQEAYVVPKKLYLFDFKSAREQLTKTQVWIREGYRYAYYPFSPTTRRADFHQEAGLIGPIEQLHITDVVSQPLAGSPGHRQVLAVFDKDGRSYALPVGTQVGNDYEIYADEMFFYEDPQSLYAFWPEETWKAIREHRLEPGMNEYQADFAVGMGVPQPGATSEAKTVKYPNGGNPLIVTYRDGKAVGIKPGS